MVAVLGINGCNVEYLHNDQLKLMDVVHLKGPISNVSKLRWLGWVNLLQRHVGKPATIWAAIHGIDISFYFTDGTLGTESKLAKSSLHWWPISWEEIANTFVIIMTDTSSNSMFDMKTRTVPLNSKLQWNDGQALCTFFSLTVYPTQSFTTTRKPVNCTLASTFQAISNALTVHCHNNKLPL